MNAPLKEQFTYQSCNGKDQNRFTEIRNAAKFLAEKIVKYTLPCADQDAAIRKVREAVMTANAAIALEGFLPEKIEEKNSEKQGERELKIIRQLILDRMEWLLDTENKPLTGYQRKEYDELKELNKKLERY